MGELKKLAEELGIQRDISFLGWQEHAEDYLQAMDVFCLPSRFEGLAISAVEAQASGLPCLVSDAIDMGTALTDLVEFLPLVEELWIQKLVGCDGISCRAEGDDRASGLLRKVPSMPTWEI